MPCNTRFTLFPYLTNAVYYLRFNFPIGYTGFTKLMEEKTLTKGNTLMIKVVLLRVFYSIFG
jgi:hypothetical protein